VPAAARNTDFIAVDHTCSTSAGIVEGSLNVEFNELGCHRYGDKNQSHIAPVPECDSSHQTTLNESSPNVFVNNLGAGRVLDGYTCASVVIIGSPNIHING
jgi:uncharacterized Zn-binding protein involved in type VI secretion